MITTEDIQTNNQAGDNEIPSSNPQPHPSWSYPPILCTFEVLKVTDRWPNPRTTGGAFEIDKNFARFKSDSV